MIVEDWAGEGGRLISQMIRHHHRLDLLAPDIKADLVPFDDITVDVGHTD